MKDGTAFDLVHRRARWMWVSISTLAIGAAAAAALFVAQPRTSVAAEDLLLIYVGAEDCAPCRAWQNGAGDDFRRSSEFARIRYREVKSPHLHDLMGDAHWPDELRGYRSHLKRSDGVPLWFVVSGDVVVAQHFGAEAWHANVLPALRSHAR
jgi:hypothetical protein